MFSGGEAEMFPRARKVTLQLPQVIQPSRAFTFILRSLLLGEFLNTIHVYIHILSYRSPYRQVDCLNKIVA